MISISVNAQNDTNGIIDKIPYKTTNIAFKDFNINEAVTAYDLALNLSYLQHISQNLNGQYLMLPIITINDNLLDEKLLREIKMSDILEYQFSSGIKIRALYGTRGNYGYLNINLKDSIKK